MSTILLGLCKKVMSAAPLTPYITLRLSRVMYALTLSAYSTLLNEQGSVLFLEIQDSTSAAHPKAMKDDFKICCIFSEHDDSCMKTTISSLGGSKNL